MSDSLAVFRGRFLLGFLFVWTVWLAGTPGVRADDPLLVTPPPKPVRIPAEFEPMRAVITGESDHFFDLYQAIVEEATLILLSSNDQAEQWVHLNLRRYGIDLDDCEVYQSSYGLIYRDCLPWFVFTDQNEPAFIHNHDESEIWSIPQYGLEQGYPVYRSGLSLEGGDFMTDGQGTAVSLDGVSFAHAEMGDEFAARIRDYWGINTYHFIENEKWGQDGYLHIDCMAKFLAPDTIMVVRVPESDIRREQSEQTAAYFRRQVSCYGTPYKVVRLDVPNREPYINSLIVNRRVLVPILESEGDANALASYEAAMPGYEVIGVSGRSERSEYTSWQMFDALHCSTMGIPDEQMLYIEHIPILSRPASSQGFPVRAKIIAHSRTEFVEGTPLVMWRTVTDANEPPADDDSVGWNAVAMARAPEMGDHQYLAYIPAQPVGTTLQYYLQAKDASDRDETHPHIGAPQAHTFTVTSVGANVSAVSAARGGTIEIYMNAGSDNALQGYSLTYAILDDSEDSEDEEPTLPETTVVTGFEDVLDDAGTGTAQMVVPGSLAADWVGRCLCFSLSMSDSPDVVLGAVRVEILE